MRRVRARRRVRIGAPDESVTGDAGVAVLAEVIDRLRVVEAQGPGKSR